MKDLETKAKLDFFTEHRGLFEKILLENRGIISAVVHKLGSGPRSVPRVVQLYNLILDYTSKSLTSDQILDELEKDKDFKFLSSVRTEGNVEEVAEEGSAFSRNTKSAVFLKGALGSPNLCPICGGLMHKNSMTVDHVVRKEDGGLGTAANGQMTHPYCNSTYKN